MFTTDTVPVDQVKALEEGRGSLHEKPVELIGFQTASTVVAPSPTLGSSTSIYSGSPVCIRHERIRADPSELFLLSRGCGDGSLLHMFLDFSCHVKIYTSMEPWDLLK